MSKHRTTHTASRGKGETSAPETEEQTGMRANGDHETDAPADPTSEPDADDVREDISMQMSERNDAADVALAAVDELADRATEFDELKQQLDAAQEQLLRNAAEFQNYRRRTEQEKSQLIELGKTIVIRHFLDIVDDFQRSLDAAEQVETDAAASEGSSAYAGLKEGVELVYRKFMDELTRLGVEPIESVGQPFDENLHEAMMQQPESDAPPGTVIEELQKGYRMGDRILRHAKVIVAA